MRIIAGISFVAVMSVGSSMDAQQSDPPVSVESIRVALQTSPKQLSLISPTLPPWIAPGPTRLGTLTLLPPDTDGEMIKANVPVGALATRVAHAVSNAQHRRAERKADERVQHALQAYQTQRPVETDEAP